MISLLARKLYLIGYLKSHRLTQSHPVADCLWMVTMSWQRKHIMVSVIQITVEDATQKFIT